MDNADPPPLVESFIDRQPLGRRHVIIVALCALAAAIDGFDAQLITYLAPAISRDLHLARPALGPIFSAGIVGMVIGSFAGGVIADRIGRKRAIVGALFFFGVFSILTAASTSGTMLLVLRLIAGLGFGAAMPNATALTTEFAPARYRATLVTIMYSGFMVGGTLGGPITAMLSQSHDWRFLFIVGGVLALVVGLVQALLLPESIRFLVAAGRPRAAVERALRFLDPGYRLGPQTVLATGNRDRTSSRHLRELFTQGRAASTGLIWLIFLSAALDLYLIVTWLPTLLQDHGMAARDSLLVTSMFQFGGLLGSLILGRLLDRLNPALTLAATFALGAASTFLIGAVGMSPPLLAVIVFLTGSLVQGGMTGLTALAADFYPTTMRSTGVGWALGISRVGGVIGPMLGAIAVAIHLSLFQLFGLAMLPVLIASGGALLLSRTAGRQQDA